MTRLLVSVRSADEADAALAGGAALIDVKDPARGSLGRAEDSVIREVIRRVAGRRPVSAALGELVDAHVAPPVGIRYAKWGVAAAAGIDWRDAFIRAQGLLPGGCRPVAVAYADWHAAAAPPPDEVCEFACAQRCGAFLVDTSAKPKLLTDHVSIEELQSWVSWCRSAGVRVALAGSLGLPEIELLRALKPDWFAVRGAACRGAQRGASIDAVRVAGLVAAVRGTRSRAVSAD